MLTVGDTVLLGVDRYATKSNGFLALAGADYYSLNVTKVTDRAIQFSGFSRNNKVVFAWYPKKGLDIKVDDTGQIGINMKFWLLKNLNGWSATFLDVVKPAISV